MTRKVRALSSGESEHGQESRAVRELLMSYICRKTGELTKTLVIYCDSVARRVEQRLGARKHCNVQVKWLWLQPAMDEIALWNDVIWMLMRLDGNELGCWCGVSRAAAKKEDHGDVDS